MKPQNRVGFIYVILVLILSACALGESPTGTPTSTNTPAATSTQTPLPTKTPLPTRTPNYAATQRSEEWNAEIQHYFDEGYIKTTDGKFSKLDDFSEEWAQINWYTTWRLGKIVSDFVISGHFKWSNASKTPNPSGCGLVFAIQEDWSYYAVFLDSSRIEYLRNENAHGRNVGKTRGTGIVDIDGATEADLALIVYDYYSYVLVNGEVIGEYTLPQSEIIEGDVGMSILSGTNKGYGTRCEITKLHLWTPDK